MRKSGMSKTITLENPITALGRFLAKRRINKLNKQIDKKQAKIQKLEAKYFQKKASENTTEKQESTKTEKVATMGSTIFFKASKFDFQKVEKILALEIEEYQTIGMKKYGDIGIKAIGSSDKLAEAINKKKRSLKKYGLHLEKFEKSLNKGAVIN